MKSARWIAGRRPEGKAAADGLYSLGDVWVRQGAITTAGVAHAAANVQKRKPGRPVTPQRQIAVMALDLRRTSALSWTKLAQKFCNCENVEHTAKCTDRLRKQVVELERFLALLSTWRKRIERFLHGANLT